MFITNVLIKKASTRNFFLFGLACAALLIIMSAANAQTFLLKIPSQPSFRFSNTILSGVAIAPDGYVWVSDGENGQIVRFDPSNPGTETRFGGYSGASGIAFDLSGNVFVVDRNNNRINKLNGSGGIITQWGSLGSGDGQFNAPIDVAVDSLGNVYVTDLSNSRVQKFTNSGTFVTKWGSNGPSAGQFNYPAGIEVDSVDNIYVVDSGNNRVQKFDPNGTFISTWGTNGVGNGQLSAPVAIAIDSSSNVYVTETYNNHRVSKFSTSGTFLTRWGSSGSADGQFNAARGIAVDAAGGVYVADTFNRRIQKFDGSGNFLTKYGSSGGGELNSWLTKLVSDPSGNLFVTDLNNNHIYKITNSGNLITRWGTTGIGDGQFSGIGGVALDSSGNVYVSDQGGRIQKFSNSGVFIAKWGSGGTGNGQFRNPGEIAVDPSGNVYVADTNNHRIQKFTNTGTFITKWGSQGTANGTFQYPKGVAVDPAGDIYVVDTNNSRVQKFTNTGVFILKWGSLGSGDGQFNYPNGISADPSGNIYVADGYSGGVEKFTNTGVFISRWLNPDYGYINTSGVFADSSNNVYALIGYERIYRYTDTGTLSGRIFIPKNTGLFGGPEAVMVDSTGNIYIADGGNYRVAKYSSAGVPLTMIGVGNLYLPTGVAVDGSGNIFVAERSAGGSTGNTIAKFSSAGNFLTRWGSTGAGDGQFNGVGDVAVDNGGNVYAVDSLNNRIQKFDNSGAFITKWGTPGTGDGQFNYPKDVALDSLGNVYVADQALDIQKFTNTGVFLMRFSTVGLSPNTLTIDSSGRIFVGGGNTVEVFSSSGSFLETWGTLGGGNGEFASSGLYDLSFDSSGNLYTADVANSRIQKFTVSPPDTVSPSVSAVSPTTAQVNIPTVFSADYSDNVGVASCNFFADGVDRGAMTLASNPSGTATFSYAYTAGGNRTAQVKCRDASSNEGVGSLTTINVSAGDALPTAAITSPSSGSTFQNSFTANFSFTDDNALQTCQYRVNGGSWQNLTPCSGTSSAPSATVTVGPSGECFVEGLDSCVVEAQATDNASQTSSIASVSTSADDGIAADIDDQPTVVSNSWTNSSVAPATVGSLIDRADHTWSIISDPSGVRIAISGSGTGLGLTNNCSPVVGIHFDVPGESAIITCGTTTVYAENALPTIFMREPPVGTEPHVEADLTTGDIVTFGTFMLAQTTTDGVPFRVIDSTVKASGTLYQGTKIDVDFPSTTITVTEGGPVTVRLSDNSDHTLTLGQNVDWSVATPDTDGDGVFDTADRCPNSVFDPAPIENRYGWLGEGVFKTRDPKTKQLTDSQYITAQTNGCSCAQILAQKPGNNSGELSFGCTKGTMDNATTGRGFASAAVTVSVGLGAAVLVLAAVLGFALKF